MATRTTAADDAGDRSGDTVGGEWLLGRLLGSGGMASVYAATSENGQRAALKLLHPEMARRRELKERFLREAYVANRIGHPGIVKILGHADGPDVFLVIELLEGEPLSARLQRASNFTVRDLLGFADQILDALAAAHAAGVVHRDIKPDNVFVMSDGKIKVLDFGIARVIDDVPSEFKTRTGLALGTIPYMAPEQALGRRGKVDGRTDLFALGALLFRALAGRRIHEEPSEAELLVAMATKPAPRLGQVAPNVPRAVCAIIDQALAFSQDARYPDAATMQADVRAVLAGEVPRHAVSAAERADDPTRVGPAPTVPLPNGPLSALDAPTVATTAPLSARTLPAAVEAPHSGRERTLESAGIDIAYSRDGHDSPPPSFATAVGVGATPAAFAADAMPASLPPHSMPHSPSLIVPTVAQPKKRRGLVAVLALGLAGVCALTALGALAFVLRPWELLHSPAAGASAEGPAGSVSTAGASPPALQASGAVVAATKDNAPDAGPKATGPAGPTGADPAATEPAKPTAGATATEPTSTRALKSPPPASATASPAPTSTSTAAAKATSTTSPPPGPGATAAQPGPTPATAPKTAPPPAASPPPATPPAAPAPAKAPSGTSGSPGDKDKDKGADKKKPK